MYYDFFEKKCYLNLNNSSKELKNFLWNFPKLIVKYYWHSEKNKSMK